MENINIDMIMEFIIKGNATLEEIEEIEKYLKQLEKDSIKLSYLEAYGVDNTLAYDEAMHAYYNSIDEEDE